MARRPKSRPAEPAATTVYVSTVSVPGNQLHRAISGCWAAGVAKTSCSGISAGGAGTALGDKGWRQRCPASICQPDARSIRQV